MYEIEKNCAALAGMLKSALEELAREKECSLRYYKECEDLKKRVEELEPKVSPIPIGGTNKDSSAGCDKW